MGSNAIIAIVVGAIVVIVGFSLWPVLNAASNNLYSYFQNSCDDGNGNRFTKMYVGITGTGDPGPQQYSPSKSIHGGSGATLSNISGNACGGTFAAAASAVATSTLYNEQGESLGLAPALAASAQTLPSPYNWIEVANMLQRFSGINNLLLTILPVISIAGFLGVSGAKLYTYGKGASNIGSAISTSIFTLIAVVVAMVIAGPILGSVVDANQVVESGQFQVNGAFANIITLLFAMIPVIYVAGLVTLVGLQAKSALMGGGKGM